MRKRIIVPMFLLFAAHAAFARSKPHYVFLLPDGFVGWVQVISQAPDSPKVVVEKGNLLVDLDDTGVFRTPSFHTTFVGARDEFFYKRTTPSGEILRVPVPSGFVCTELSGMDTCYTPSEEKGADGFTVGRATVGISGPSHDGSSWFFFIGQPALRQKNTVRVIFKPGTKKWMDHPENDPTPGRIKND
jgi:hypothetical protein